MSLVTVKKLILGSSLFVTVLLFILIYVLYISWQKFTEPITGHVSLSETIDPNSFDLPLIKHQFISLDGTELVGYSAVSNNPQGWIILVHGYTNNGWKSMLSPANFFYDNNYNVFLVSLRNYGESEGTQTFLGIKEWQDVIAADNFVRNSFNFKESTKHPLPQGWYGVSMGANSSLTAAGKISSLNNTPPDFIIAQVPFISVQHLIEKQIVEQKLPRWFFKPLSFIFPRIRFGVNYRQNEALTNIESITAPLLVIGAQKDNQVFFEDSLAVYEKVATPVENKYFYSLDTGHDVYSEKQNDVEIILKDFLDIL